MKPISKWKRVFVKLASLLFLMVLGTVFGASAWSDPAPLKLLLLVGISVFAMVVVVHSWGVIDG